MIDGFKVGHYYRYVGNRGYFLLAFSYISPEILKKSYLKVTNANSNGCWADFEGVSKCSDGLGWALTSQLNNFEEVYPHNFVIDEIDKELND